MWSWIILGVGVLCLIGMIWVMASPEELNDEE